MKEYKFTIDDIFNFVLEDIEFQTETYKVLAKLNVLMLKHEHKINVTDYFKTLAKILTNKFPNIFECINTKEHVELMNQLYECKTETMEIFCASICCKIHKGNRLVMGLTVEQDNQIYFS